MSAKSFFVDNVSSAQRGYLGIAREERKNKARGTYGLGKATH